MKYLKSWSIFEADEIGTDDVKEVSPDEELEKETQTVRKDALGKISKDLAEYKQKRQVLDDIFKKILMTVLYLKKFKIRFTKTDHKIKVEIHT